MSVEQRTAIKFCVLNGKNRKETMVMLVKAYGDAAMKRTALHKWYSQYKNGYKSVMDEQRSGRPTSKTSQKVQEIKELLDKDRRITVREVNQRVECSVGTVHTIIHDNLDMRRLCARLYPKMLSECQCKRAVGPGVTTQRYHYNGRLVMLEVNCIKFSLGIHNSLGIIMCKPFSKKLREWQHLSAYFLNTPRTCTLHLFPIV